MLTDYKIPIDRYTIRATDFINGRLAAVKDLDGKPLVGHAERLRNSERSMVKTEYDVYTVLRILDNIDLYMDQSGVPMQKRVECVLYIIFKIGTDEDGNGVDIQAWADGLLEWVKLHLQPKREDNIYGYDPVYPMPFQWSTDTNFSARLGRGVTKLDGQPKSMSGTLYVIPYQFKIDVNTNLEAFYE